VAITVSVAQSASVLLPALAGRLAVAQSDPFAPDIVVVPSVGQRDWLTEELGARLVPASGGPGICANVEFWLPADFNRRVVATGPADDDPWDPTPLTWTILGLLHSHAASAPRFDESRRPLAVAQRVAELFDRYGVHRPELLRHWQHVVATTNGQGEQLPGAYRWQRELWQVLRGLLGPSPGERFLDATEHVRPGAVPGRMSIFGLEQFSTAMVGLLNGLATMDDADAADIAVFGVFPSPGAVADITGLSAELAASATRARRDVDVSAVLAHPLVRSWGVSGAEAVALLGTLPGDITVTDASHGESVLARVQASIAADAPLVVPGEATASQVLNRCDGTIQIHQCHGASRQVEVLRDALLHLMNDDPTLTARDIVVICPNLDTFAPLVGPVLGATIAGVRLPVQVIERSSSTATAVADTLDALLGTVGGRLTVSDVRSLLTRTPVRRRFGLTDDDLDTISRWLDDLDMRWGIDPGHRSESPWNYPLDVVDGTWRQTLDRLAAGLLVQAPQMREAPSGVAPFDDLGGSDIDTVGRLVDVVDALDALAHRCRGTHTADQWADIVADAMASFVAVDPDDRWQVDDVQAVADQLRGDAPATHGALLAAPEIRSWVVSRLNGTRSGGNRWGDVIRVASLTRLRGVPARVVAILGFDQDAFRSGSNDGDDILSIDPRIGERDLHAEQRLGLLTTVCAPSDALVITCNGFDVTNNKRIPMAIALEELADTVAAVVVDADDAGTGRPLVVSHARQAADPVNFGHAGDDAVKNAGQFVEGSWTFDPTAAAVADEVRRVRRAGPGAQRWPVLPDGPDPDADRPLTVADLVDAVRRPSDVFLRTRLGVTLPARREDVVEDVTLWPGSLHERGLGAELVAARRSGVDIAEWRHLRSLTGGLPPGELRVAFLDTLEEAVGRLFAVGGVSPVVTGVLDVDTTVDGRDIVDALDVCGHQLVTMAYSNWHPRHQLRAWLQLAAATVSRPESEWEAVIVALSTNKAKVAGYRLTMVGDTSDGRLASAMNALRFALDMRRRALQSAIPLFERSSWTVKHGLLAASDEDLSYDLQRPAAGALFSDLADLVAMRSQQLIPGIDDGLAAAPDRASAYAATLVAAFTSSVNQVKLPSSADEASGTSGGPPAAGVAS
jgi:exodeoxyribonuclease V gamma subunit